MVSAMGGHFLFDDDQETPNVLNATYYFDSPDGKRKMMELEVRPWITNHEAEIGTGAYKSSGIPAAGLATSAPVSAPAKRVPDPLAGIGPVGPVDAKTNTIGNLF
jgi:hypothetical protein